MGFYKFSNKIRLEHAFKFLDNEHNISFENVQYNYVQKHIYCKNVNVRFVI